MLAVPVTSSRSMGNDSSKAVKGDGDGQEKSQPNAKVTAHRVPCPRLISVCDSIATRVCADVCTRAEARGEKQPEQVQVFVSARKRAGAGGCRSEYGEENL